MVFPKLVLSSTYFVYFLVFLIRKYFLEGAHRAVQKGTFGGDMAQKECNLGKSRGNVSKFLGWLYLGKGGCTPSTRSKCAISCWKHPGGLLGPLDTSVSGVLSCLKLPDTGQSFEA